MNSNCVGFPSLGFELTSSSNGALVVAFVGSAHLAAAGVSVGDILISVDGEIIAEAPLFIAKKVLEEITGSRVILRFQKKGLNQTKDVIIERAPPELYFALSSNEPTKTDPILPKSATYSPPSYRVSDADVRLVMQEANVSYEEAVMALKQSGNDAVEAVMKLGSHFSFVMAKQQHEHTRDDHQLPSGSPIITKLSPSSPSTTTTSSKSSPSPYYHRQQQQQPHAFSSAAFNDSLRSNAFATTSHHEIEQLRYDVEALKNKSINKSSTAAATNNTIGVINNNSFVDNHRITNSIPSDNYGRKPASGQTSYRRLFAETYNIYSCTEFDDNGMPLDTGRKRDLATENEALSVQVNNLRQEKTVLQKSLQLAENELNKLRDMLGKQGMLVNKAENVAAGVDKLMEEQRANALKAYDDWKNYELLADFRATRLPTLAVVTASSNCGSSCIKELMQQYPDKFGKIKVGFRTQEKADILRSQPYYSAEKIEIFSGIDAAQAESLIPLFSRVDCALVVTPMDHSRGFEKDGEYAMNMVKAAHAAGVKKVVFVSSWTVNDVDGIGAIARRFSSTESLLTDRLKSMGLSYVIIRGGYFANNFVHMFGSSIKERNSIVLPEGFTTVPVDVDDIGRSCAAAMANSNHADKIFEISGPASLDAVALADIFTQVLNKPIQAETVPIDEYCQQLSPALSELIHYIVAHGNKAIPISNDSSTLTGKSPVSFQEWLEEHKALFS